MTKDKALKLAREGVEIHSLNSPEYIVCAALIEALAQPEQEPWGACVSGRVFVGELPEHVRKLAEDEGLIIQWLYTTPPQRKPLTDEQMWELWNSQGDDAMEQQAAIAFARAIESAHGIKGDA
jgi:hypothetical protein